MGLYILVRGLRRTYERRGVYPRGLVTIAIAAADQNMFSSFGGGLYPGGL